MRWISSDRGSRLVVADWLPRFYTARKSDQTDGGFVADFGASFLHVSKGVQACHP